MKKTLLLFFVCAVSTHAIAQKTKAQKAETSNQLALSVNDIPPPPPPAPPLPPLPPEPPILAVPPTPPAPPVKKEN